jgi:putative FmdB family regulatory protein
VPIYEYYCATCGKEIEVLQKMDDIPPICCIDSKDKTMSGEMKRKISNIAPPVFKGSGFYATDYKKKGFSKPDKKVEKSKGKKNEGNKKKQK